MSDPVDRNVPPPAKASAAEPSRSSRALDPGDGDGAVRPARALTDAERWLVRCWRARRRADFAGESGAEIDAELVARMLRRGSSSSDGRHGGRTRVEIVGARIVGVLDLRDCVAGEAAAPSLTLIDCVIADGILVDDLHLRRLDLRGCALPGLSANGCRIDGDIDLSGIRPAEPDGGECRVQLNGARIGGSLNAGRAALRVRRRTRHERDPAGADVRYALELRNAVVSGRIVLQPSFRAEGGINLNSASVEGEIWAGGASIEGGEGDAFKAQSLRAHGSVMLRGDLDADGRPLATIVRGSMNFGGAAIEGGLDLAGAIVDVALDDEGRPATAERSGINLSMATVRGPLGLGTRSVEAAASPALRRLGALDADGASIFAPPPARAVADEFGVPAALARIDWQELEPALAREVAGDLVREAGREPSPLRGVRAHVAACPFFPGMRLLHVAVSAAAGTRRYLMLTDFARVVPLAPGRRVAELPAPMITDETVVDYLRLDLFLRYPETGIVLLEPPARNPLAEQVEPSEAAVIQHARAIEVRDFGQDGFGLRARIGRHGWVEEAIFAIEPDGTLTLVEEKQVSKATLPAQPDIVDVRTTFALRCSGNVWLDGAQLGHVDLTGASITHVVSADRARIAGDLQIGNDRSTSIGRLDLTSAEISGSVELSGSYHRGSGDPSLQDIVIAAGGAVIGGDLRIGEVVGAGAGAKQAQLYGGIDLEQASIGRDLLITNTRVRGALDARSVRVGGNVELRNVTLGHGAQFDGVAASRSVEVDADSPLLASFVQADVRGNYVLDRVAVRGDKRAQRTRLSLQDAGIGGELRVRSFFGDRSGVLGRPHSGRIGRIRSCPLSCYPGWLLHEVEVDWLFARELAGRRSVPEEAGVVAFLARRWGRWDEHADIRQLDGTSPPFHELNRTGALRIASVQQAREYLQLFTSYVWGDEGLFRIVDPTSDARIRAAADRSQIKPIAATAEAEGNEQRADEAAGGTATSPTKAVSLRDLPPLTVWRDPAHEGAFRAEATVIYGDAIFEATFAIRPLEREREIVMLEDAPRFQLGNAGTDTTIRPVRFAAALATDEQPWPPTILEAEWTELKGDRLAKLRQRLPELLRPSATSINLRDARTDRLDDLNGDAWSGALRLELDGFTYDRAPHEPEPSGLERRKERKDPMAALVAMLRIDDFEDAVLHTALTNRAWRRPLACNPHWSIIEVPTELDLDAGPGAGAATRNRKAMLSFLWREREATTNAAALAGAAAGGNVIVLSDRTVTPAADRIIASSADEPAIDSIAAAEDCLRLQLYSIGLDGTRYRIVENGDAALSKDPAYSHVPLEVRAVTDSSNDRGYTFTATITDGRTLRVIRGTLGADGRIASHELGDASPVHDDWSEEYFGPFRVLDVAKLDDADANAASAWGAKPPRADAEQTPKRVDGVQAQDPRPAAGWKLVRADEAAAIVLDVLPEFARHLERLGRSQAPAAPTQRAGRRFDNFIADTANRLGIGDFYRQEVNRFVRWFDNLLGRRKRARREARLRWLGRQYAHGGIDHESYRPHPYEVAAAAFRNEGDSHSARGILSAKITTENRMRGRGSPIRWFQACNRLFFDYGLSTGRAIFWTLAIFLIGWGTTFAINRANLLVIDFTPAATVLVPVGGETPDGRMTFEFASAIAEPGSVPTPIPCGNVISDAVFAADLMVPILDFGQVKRCQIASPRPGEGGARRWLLVALRIGQSLYAALGAIFVSMTILTVSGVLRRHAES